MEISSNNIYLFPQLYSNDSKAMLKLELSPKVTASSVLSTGKKLPRPPFKTSIDCFIGDAIGTIYNFCSNNGTTLRENLEYTNSAEVRISKKCYYIVTISTTFDLYLLSLGQGNLPTSTLYVVQDSSIAVDTEEDKPTNDNDQSKQ